MDQEGVSYFYIPSEWRGMFPGEPGMSGGRRGMFPGGRGMSGGRRGMFDDLTTSSSSDHVTPVSKQVPPHSQGVTGSPDRRADEHGMQLLSQSPDDIFREKDEKDEKDATPPETPSSPVPVTPVSKQVPPHSQGVTSSPDRRADEHGMQSLPQSPDDIFRKKDEKDPAPPATLSRPVPVTESKGLEDSVPKTNVSYVIDINDSEVNYHITSSVKKKFTSLDDAVVVDYRQPKIRKIPSILRGNKYYEPRVMAIGPYHHKNLNLMETEKLKLKLAALFIEEHKLRKEVLYSKIKREIKYLRECYEEEEIVLFTDDELAWMFFVDGCALLHYMYCLSSCLENEDTSHAIRRKDAIIRRLKDLRIKVDFLTIVKQDLLLLENQLPFPVLVLLISCLEEEKQHEIMESIEMFIFNSTKALGEENNWRQSKDPIKLPIHLLDLLRTRILESDKEDQMMYSTSLQLSKKFFEFMSEPVKNLMEYIGQTFENFPCKQTNNLHFFRNVEELKSTGIRLRPSKTGRLTDITFSLGTLKLPSILVDDSTASKFLNLVAYEMSPDFLNDFGVSSYIAFLDNLIDQAGDVKELRHQQVLHNYLGSDEDVAKLFNEIGTNIVSNPKIYENVKKSIQKRYDNKLMTWIAQLNHQYFRNPWSMLALFGAMVAVVSTVIQAVYSVLGYYNNK